jgi:hypothetical protein
MKTDLNTIKALVVHECKAETPEFINRMFNEVMLGFTELLKDPDAKFGRDLTIEVATMVEASRPRLNKNVIVAACAEWNQRNSADREVDEFLSGEGK